jgi:hypothetical protein
MFVYDDTGDEIGDLTGKLKGVVVEKRHAGRRLRVYPQKGVKESVVKSPEIEKTSQSDRNKSRSLFYKKEKNHNGVPQHLDTEGPIGAVDA